MDRYDHVEVEELGVASAETLGTRAPYPELIGFDVEPQGSGITAD